MGKKGELLALRALRETREVKEDNIYRMTQPREIIHSVLFKNSKDDGCYIFSFFSFYHLATPTVQQLHTHTHVHAPLTHKHSTDCPSNFLTHIITAFSALSCPTESHRVSNLAHTLPGPTAV